MLRELSDFEMEEVGGGLGLAGLGAFTGDIILPNFFPTSDPTLPSSTGGHCDNTSPFTLINLGPGLGYQAIPNPAHGLCAAETSTPTPTPIQPTSSGGGFGESNGGGSARGLDTFDFGLGGGGRTGVVSIQDFNVR